MLSTPKLKMSLLFLWNLQTSTIFSHMIQAEESYKNNPKWRRKPMEFEEFIHFKKISKSKLSSTWFLPLLILFSIPIFSKLNSTISSFISSKKSSREPPWKHHKFRPKEDHKNKLSSSQAFPTIFSYFGLKLISNINTWFL